MKIVLTFTDKENGTVEVISNPSAGKLSEIGTSNMSPAAAMAAIALGAVLKESDRANKAQDKSLILVN